MFYLQKKNRLRISDEEKNTCLKNVKIIEISLESANEYPHIAL